MIDHARHGAVHLACLYRLLSGAGQALLPLYFLGFAFFRCQGWWRLWLVSGTRLLLFLLFLFRWLWRRLLITAAFAAALAVFVIQVLVDGFLAVVFFQQRVDLLGGHALVFIHDQGVVGRCQPVFHQQGIDGVVAGEVPAVQYAVLPPGKMGKGAVQCLVGEHELGLGQGQGIDVFRIVVEVPGIGARGPAPVGVGFRHGQAQHQRAEKRLVQDQARACGCQLGLDFLPVQFSHRA